MSTDNPTTSADETDTEFDAAELQALRDRVEELQKNRWQRWTLATSRRR